MLFMTDELYNMAKMQIKWDNSSINGVISCFGESYISRGSEPSQLIPQE